MTTPLTTSAVARHFNVPSWKVRRLYERGFLDHPPNVGTYRAVDPDDLPKVEAALRSAGYLPSEATAPAPPSEDRTRPEERSADSPADWFGELLHAVDRGDYRRAIEAQRALGRLGWSVVRRTRRNKVVTV